MQEFVMRWFKVIAGVIGALVSGDLAISGIKEGSIPGLFKMDIVTGTTYSKVSQGPQFWFIILLLLASCAAFIWWAWSAYRD